MKLFTYTQNYAGTDTVDLSIQFVTDSPGEVPDEDNITPEKNFENLSLQAKEALYEAVQNGAYDEEDVESINFDDFLDSEWLKENYS